MVQHVLEFSIMFKKNLNVLEYSEKFREALQSVGMYLERSQVF